MNPSRRSRAHTDGRTDMTKIIGAIHNDANEPENKELPNSSNRLSPEGKYSFT